MLESQVLGPPKNPGEMATDENLLIENLGQMLFINVVVILIQP